MQARAGVHPFLGPAERRFEALGRIVLHHGTLSETGAVVPADGHMRIIRDGELGVELVPLLVGAVQDGLVVVIHPDEVAELVVGHAVETEVPDEGFPGPAGIHLRFVHTAVVELAVPHRELEFQVREPGILHFLPEPGQGVPGLLHAADSLDERVHFIDHEHRLSVDLVVVRLLEKQLDVPLADLLELLPVHTPAVDDVPFLMTGDAGIPVVADVVVGPHQVELHLVPVAGLQEAFREGRFHPRAAVQPVPVEDKYVHAMAGGLVDFHLHHGRIGLVDVAPEGMAVPGMAGIPFLHGEHRLPFAQAHGPEGPQAHVVGRIGRIQVGRHVIGLGGCVEQGDGEGRDKQQSFHIPID